MYVIFLSWPFEKSGPNFFFFQLLCIIKKSANGFLFGLKSDTNMNALLSKISDGFLLYLEDFKSSFFKNVTNMFIDFTHLIHVENISLILS